MLPVSHRADSLYRVSVRAHLSAFAVCILFATVLLLIGNGKAQVKAGQIDTFIYKLQSLNSKERSIAAEQLGKLGAEAQEAVPALISALKDQDASVRSAAATALGFIGSASPIDPRMIINQYRNYQSLLDLVPKTVESKDDIPTLVTKLKHQNTDIRINAVVALMAKNQPEAKNAVPALINALNDQDARVRSSAARALGQIGTEVKDVVPALVNALNDQDARVRSSAARALGQIRTETREVINALINMLDDQDASVRLSSASALGLIGQGASKAVRALINKLTDPDVEVRNAAIVALGQLGPEAKAAVPLLIRALNDQNAETRNSAYHSLGMIGPEAEQAVPSLINALKSQDTVEGKYIADSLGRIGRSAVPALINSLSDQDAKVRNEVIIALGQVGPEATAAVPALINSLNDQDAHIRRSVAKSLGKIGPEARQAVLILAKTLDDQDIEVCRSAAFALGEIGSAAQDAVPALIKTLQNKEALVHSSAAEALAKIATASFDSKNTASAVGLEDAYRAMKDHADPDVKKRAEEVKRMTVALKSISPSPLESVQRVLIAHPYLSGVIGVYLLLPILWLMLLWLRPLWLLHISAFLGRYEPKIKAQNAEINLPLRYIALLSLFHYHPRVLDSWVRRYIADAKENFARKQTVAQRKVYVSMPTLIDNQMRESISAAVAQPMFEKKKVTLLIAGEGGAGKTSLACQMAIWAMAYESEQRLCKTHQMLPVLIEANLEPRTDNKDSLVEAVRGGLRELVGEPEPIFEELLLHLLRKRRVLVIVDSLSELDEATHKSVRPAHADFPVAALVVTSRIDEALGGASKSLLRPLRLQSNRLSEFMDGYLKQFGKRKLFDDPEYFAACGRLSEIVGDREITVLIAKMYAEQMIAAKEKEAGAQISERELPRNLPDLMLGYVKRLNDQVKDGRQDIRKAIKVAKIAAWECLKQTCRPTTAKRDDVLNALSKESDTEALLKYLEDRLQLIQATGPISDLIRFSLDPLAEYLAALYLVERCGKFEDLWQEFFENAEKQPGAPEVIKGFLLAVRDCCVEKGSEYNVPDWVGDKISQFAGLDPKAVQAAQFKQRVNHWVSNLKSPYAEDRKTAIEKLSDIGPEAKEALPALITALRDQSVGVRNATLYAIGRIGPAAKDAVPALTLALNDPIESIRCGAAFALWEIEHNAEEVLPTLINSLTSQDLDIRRTLPNHLRVFGSEAIKAVPALIDLLNDSDEYVVEAVTKALGSIGSNAAEAIPTLVTIYKKPQNAYLSAQVYAAIMNIDPEAIRFCN